MILNDIYDKQITILNRLRRDDSVTGLDVWHKTTVDKCAWYTESERGVSGNQALVATVYTVLIPFDERYVPYIDWKQAGRQEGNYTMSAGDYVILGEVSEEITANNVVATMQKYGARKCQVKAIRELDARFMNRVQLKVEGV